MSPEGGSIERRVRNAAAAGASVVVVSGTSLPAGALDLEDGIAVPVVAVPADAGREAIEAAAEGTAATLELSAAEKLPNESLMDIAPFSSGGVAFDGRVKPDLVAPGVGLATSDAGAEGYATVTGSSAAAAVAAGAAALVVEARPGLGALELKSTLVGSGGRLRRGDDPLGHLAGRRPGRSHPRRHLGARRRARHARLRACGRREVEPDPHPHHSQHLQPAAQRRPRAYSPTTPPGRSSRSRPSRRSSS